MSTKHPPDAVRGHLTWLLNQAGGHGKAMVVARLGERGIRPPHYVMLLTLRESGPMSQAELGRRTGLDRSDVTGGMRLLVEKELVQQTVDADDRRRNAVSLTPEGGREIDTLHDLVEQAQRDFVAPLTTEQQDQLRWLLTTLLDHHGG